ncbi:glucuronyl esterase domain-containing protein [Planctomicrobium sp. SH527]|uniref:glucuronyl esterase domain-containing protein n=1 Tax=Planctomicrobium sp. SH527 TaxID=3448123 RepID=UPI003F5C8B61
MLLNRLQFAAAAVLFLSSQQSFAAPPPTHTDELKVPKYTLPDPLTFADGTPVKTAEDWIQRRRPELLEAFASMVYGQSPPTPTEVKFEVISQKDDAINGKAIRKEIAITLVSEPKPVVMTMLLYIPKSTPKAPVFWGLNFRGNHSITAETDVQLNPNWVTSNSPGVVENKSTEESRGTRTNRWPIEMILDRGFALATAYYGDIDPDFDDGFQNGVHSGFYRDGQTKPADHEWGTIAGWAWGLSRGLDVLEKEPLVDATKVAVIGHSRLGKTSLWAGAADPRFAIVISNNSGCGGAALSRRAFGETVARINYAFPHWFCTNFKRYDNHEEALPVDQHQLVALIAPRPVYVASATEDLWADPKGEFLSARFADPVYRLLGTDGFGGTVAPEESPAPDQPLNSGTIGYHLRTGKHDINDYDWGQYLDFASRHYKARSKE